MARAEGLPSRCTSRFYLIMMTKKQIEIADFILSQFLEGSPNKDDVHSAINDTYGYDIDPYDVLQSLQDEGLVYEWGEAYYKLTPQGENAAKKGYNKQKRRQERLTLLKEYKEYINIICTIITIASMCITIIISLMK